MKKQFFLVALLLLSYSAFSQKIDLDKLVFAHASRSLPEKPLPTKMHSYKVIVNSTMPEANNVSKAEGLSISGFTRDQSNGQVSVKFKFDDIIINKTTPLERVDVRKDKDGKETGRSYYYKMEIQYTLNASCMAVGADGSSIYNHFDSPKRTYNSQEFGASIDAQNFWSNNIVSLKNKMVDDVMNDYIRFCSIAINNLVGYQEKNQSKILWITDSPKHPENEAFMKNTKSALQKLKSISANNNVSDIAKSLEEEIKYFEEIKNKYTSSEKPDMKLRYGAYYNLGTIYYCIDQPANAKQVGEALVANDFDKSDGKIIITESDNLVSSMTLNKLNTTHFSDEFLNKQ